MRHNPFRISRDQIPHYVRIISQMAREFVSTRTAYLRAHWWGIKIGNKCTFVGQPHIRKTPGSTISIGSRCRFLSLFHSNLHGLSRGCMISTLSPQACINIGNSVGLSGVVLAASQSIMVGDRVFIGANTTISDTNSHSLSFIERSPESYLKVGPNWREPISSSPIIIEDDVFIGMHSIILKGVRIGRGTVVGAGSVVSRDLPEFCIAAGNPAKPINWLRNYFPDIETK